MDKRDVILAELEDVNNFWNSI